MASIETGYRLRGYGPIVKAPNNGPLMVNTIRGETIPLKDLPDHALRGSGSHY